MLGIKTFNNDLIKLCFFIIKQFFLKLNCSKGNEHYKQHAGTFLDWLITVTCESRTENTCLIFLERAETVDPRTPVKRLSYDYKIHFSSQFLKVEAFNIAHEIRLTKTNWRSKTVLNEHLSLKYNKNGVQKRII